MTSTTGDRRHPLREAHAHLPWLGKALDMPSLEGCESAQHALDRIAAEASRLADLPTARWLQSHSARAESWADGKWFSRKDLDKATGPRPTAVMSFDHHAVFANSAALEMARIGRGTPDPPGGVIEKNKSGEPTGLLLETAAFSLWALAPEPDTRERKRQIVNALHHLSDLGFVEVHDLLSPPWLGPLLREILDSDAASMSVGLFAAIDDIERCAASRSAWERNDLKLFGGKTFADGTLNSRTAWVLEPFADAPPGLEHGKPILTSRQIADAIDRCRVLDLGIAIHAIGDGAVRACLDGVAMTTRRGAHSLSIRIEHCEIIDACDVPRFAELGVLASVQPCHLLADVEALRRGLPDRLDRVMPWRDLIASGLVPGESLLFGSDVPVVRADPRDSVQAAVHRRRLGRPAAEAIGMNQALTEVQSLACFEVMPNSRIG